MAENISRKKLVSDIPELLSNLNTTLRNWANGAFSKQNHTHTADSIGIPLFAPDFSRRIKIYSSADDPNGRGFRCVNTNNATSEYNARIFQLKYPCFIYSQCESFNRLDSDMILEMCANKENVIAASKFDNNNINRYQAAVYRDSTYCNVIDSRDTSTSSFLIPLGSVNYWHHYATGFAGSADTGDIKYRTYYIVPAYGTPENTTLIDLYAATYTGQKLRTAASDSEYWLNKLKTSSLLRTVKA